MSKSKYGMPKKEIGKILRKAAAYIEQHGLSHRVLEDPINGSVCMLGALCKVQGLPVTYSSICSTPIYNVLSEACQMGVYTYSDNVCYPFRERAVKKLREVAATCR